MHASRKCNKFYDLSGPRDKGDVSFERNLSTLFTIMLQVFATRIKKKVCDKNAKLCVCVYCA